MSDIVIHVLLYKTEEWKYQREKVIFIDMGTFLETKHILAIPSILTQ